MFDVSLGKYTGSDYTMELKEDAKPYHAKPFPIPKTHEPTLKKEVNILIESEVLKKINNSKWAAPTLIILKINQIVTFISDFRELNKRIKQKPFLIPKYSKLIT